MKDRKLLTTIVVGIIAIFLAIAITVFNFGVVMTDECAGQSCPANVSVTLGNAQPAIYWVENISNVVLTGGTTKTVYVSFNASDTNGYEDLDHSTAQVVLYKSGEADRTSSSCSSIVNTSTETQFNCTVEMQFYDSAAADWAINASVSDIGGPAHIENVTQTFTVNALDYVSQNTASVAWATAFAGQVNEADNTINLTNGGNQDYTSIDMTAYNATGAVLSDIITAGSFSVDGETGQSIGGVSLVDSTATAIESEINGFSGHGASITDEIFFYVNVTSGLRPDTYEQDTTWAIAVS